VGYMVTRVRATEGIHPKVIAVSNTFGMKFGRVATAKPKDDTPAWTGPGMEDRDMANIWWKNTGVNPNDIIPVSADPIGGSQGWYDTVVTVTPAQSGDNFGDVKVDNAKHFEFYKETIRYAYTGDKHRAMHPEVKVGKLPPAELKKGH